jgi:hypothetical protein
MESGIYFVVRVHNLGCFFSDFGLAPSTLITRNQFIKQHMERTVQSLNQHGLIDYKTQFIRKTKLVSFVLRSSYSMVHYFSQNLCYHFDIIVLTSLKLTTEITAYVSKIVLIDLLEIIILSTVIISSCSSAIHS